MGKKFNLTEEDFGLKGNLQHERQNIQGENS